MKNKLHALKITAKYRKLLKLLDEQHQEKIHQEKSAYVSRRRKAFHKGKDEGVIARLKEEHHERLQELADEHSREKARLITERNAEIKKVESKKRGTEATPPVLPPSYEPISPEKEAEIQESIAAYKSMDAQRAEREAEAQRRLDNDLDITTGEPLTPEQLAEKYAEEKYKPKDKRKKPASESLAPEPAPAPPKKTTTPNRSSRRIEAAPVVIPPKEEPLPMADITDEEFAEPLKVGEIVGQTREPAAPIGASEPKRAAPTVAEKLHWPTPNMPAPPAGFKPEMMDVPNWDNLAKKLTPKIGHKAAYDVANFVKDYSAKPVHVANRAAERLGEQGRPDDLRAVLEQVKEQTDELKRIHTDLLKSGYGMPAKTSPANPEPSKKPNVVEKKKAQPEENVAPPAGVPPMPPKPPAPPASLPPPGPPNNNPDRPGGYPHPDFDVGERKPKRNTVLQAAEADVSQRVARKGIARNIARTDKAEAQQQEREEKRRQKEAEQEQKKHEKLKEELREKAKAAREAHARRSLGRQVLMNLGFSDEQVDAAKMFIPGRFHRLNAVATMANRAMGGGLGRALGGLFGGGRAAAGIAGAAGGAGAAGAAGGSAAAGGVGAALLGAAGGPVGIAIGAVVLAGVAAYEFAKKLHEAIKAQIEFNRRFADASPLMARVFGLMEVEQFRLRLEMGNRLADSAEGLAKSFVELQKGTKEINILWNRFKNSLFTVINNVATAMIRPFENAARRFNEILDELIGGARGREGNLFIDLLQNEANRVFNLQAAGPMPGF